MGMVYCRPDCKCSYSLCHGWIESHIISDSSNKAAGKNIRYKKVVQYLTIPVGILLGGYLADYVFEPLMASNYPVSMILQKNYREWFRKQYGSYVPVNGYSGDYI